MRDSLLRSLNILRSLVLLAGTLGVLLALDVRSTDPLGPKSFAFAAAAGMLAGLTALRFWWGGRLHLPRGPLALALLACLGALALSYFSLPALVRPRSESAFNAWCLLALLILAVFDWLQDLGSAAAPRIFYLVSCCMALALAIALAGRLGWDPTLAAKVARGQFGPLASSWSGNPNFFAGFLVLALPAPLWLAWKRHRAWMALVLAAAAGILASHSKAASLALVLQYFTFGHLIWRGQAFQGARVRWIKSWAAIGAAVLLWAALSLGLQWRNNLAAPFSASRASVQFRLVTWQGALKAFAARPLLGHGPGSFALVYPAHRLPEAMASQSQHSYEVTHAENALLQMAVETGALGLLGFVVFFSLLGRMLWRQAMQGGENEAALAACLGLGLAGSLACNLAALDLFLPSTFWFVGLDVALALALFGKEKSIGLNAETYAAALASACILFFSLMPGIQSLTRWRSGRDLAAAEQLSRSGDLSGALPDYDRALLADPLNIEALYFKGKAQLELGLASAALQSFEKLGLWAPDYVLLHDLKARALLQLARQDEAALEWQRQLELDPWYFPALQGLADLYAGQGRITDAIRVLETAAPRFPERQDLLQNLELLRKKER